MRSYAGLLLILAACATSGEQRYYPPDQSHPSTELVHQFYPDQGMPTGAANNQEFFHKKCSPRSPSNHYSKTEYFCN